MKMKMKEIGLVICFTSLCLASTSAQKVTIDAEFRPRAEYGQGFKSPLKEDYNASGIILQRTRLGASYETNWLNTRITLQDSRTFGEVDTKQPTSATTGSVSVFEAWADLLVLPGTSFKIGRQGLQFEDGRLFSLSSWSNTGISHDLAQLMYSMPGLSAELGYAYNNKTAIYSDTLAYNSSSVTMYKQLAFLHLTKSITNSLNFTLLGVDEGFQTQKSTTELLLNHRYTTGGTVSLKNDSLPFGFLFTGYYQFGKGFYSDKNIAKSTSTVKDLNAFLLAIKANYDITKKIGVNAGIDYFSGSKSDIDTLKTNTFNKLPYCGNHTFDGGMEYWSTIPSGGLINYSAGLTYKFNDKLNVAGTYLINFLARDMKIKNAATKQTEFVQNNLGSEVDLILNYKFSPETAVQLGWSTYFVTNGTKLLKYKDTSASMQFPMYAYLMLTIKPKFFTSK
jgi:hypothetical protein